MLAALVREREPAPILLRYLPPAARAVLDLHRGGCRWPLGDVETDEFRFCAAPRQAPCSYCAAHARLAGPRR